MAPSPHVEEHLEDLALGTLAPGERAVVEAHLAACPACRALLEGLEAGMETLSGGIAAPGLVLQRLELALAGAGRFSHLVGDLQRLFDLPGAGVQALLERVDDPAAWEEGLAPGVQLMPVEAGPLREGFMTALVLLAPGAVFPEHTHGAEEQVLVLEGGYRCSTGVEKWRGELDVRAAGTCHAFTAFADAPCLCAAVTKPPEA